MRYKLTKLFKTLLLSLLLFQGFSGAAYAAFTFTRTSSPVFYMDSGITPALVGMYAAYQVTTDTDVDDAWVQIGNFSGGFVSLATNEDGVVHLGAMTAGSSKMAFFYLQTTGDTATPQSHDLTVYDSNPALPGATSLATSAPFTMTAEETISAAANQIDTVVSGPIPPSLGGIVTITVTGSTGVIGNGKTLSFTPASYADWAADKYELFETSIVFSGGTTLTDQLYVTGFSPTTNQTYTATYKFRATGITTAPTAVSPVGYIASGGSNMKHTATGGFAALPPIQPADNYLLLSNTVSPTTLPPSGGTVTYTLRLSNSGAYAASVDNFINTLASSPAAATYVAGSSTWNGVAIADPNISGSDLYWSGNFSVPAGGFVDLTFQATIPGTSGTDTYTDSAYALIGSEQIDSTLDTTDNAPATSTLNAVLVNPTITKAFSPTNIAPDEVSTITLTLGNTNAIDLTSVAFTDTLPTSPASMVVAATPNASNTCGGTLTATAGSGSASLSGGTISASGSCTVSFDVTAPSVGSYSNTVGSFSTTETSTDYTVTPATLTVELLPTIAVSFSPSSIAINGTSTLTITITNPDLAQTLSNVGLITDAYTSGLVNASTPNAATTCTGGTATATGGGNTVALSGASMAVNSSCTITVDVTSASAGSYVATVAASALTNTEGKTNLSSASATLPVLDPPTVAKAFSPSSIAISDTSVLTVTLTNPNSTAITGAAFTDTYPANLVNTSSASGATTCSGGTVTAANDGGSLALSGGTIPASGSCTVTVNVTSGTSGSYNNSTGSVTTTNAGTGSSASATLNVGAPDIVMLKSVVTYSDPVNNTTNPKAIPGATMLYTITVTNQGAGSADSDSVVITDPIPANTEFFSGDINGAGSGPVLFTDGTPVSGLSYTFTSLASTTDNISFSSDNGSTWTYVPSGGYDSAVTNLKVSPGGPFNGTGGGNPSFTLKFRVRVQ